MNKLILFVGAFALVVVTGCQDGIVDAETAGDVSVATQTLSKNGAQLGGMIWADGELFRTLGTPALFNPDQGNFDILFTGDFKDEVGAISESKPGDQDYNGGRWEVWALKEGVVTDYSNADSVDDLDVNDFEPTGTYFECPLRPQRGKGPN